MDQQHALTVMTTAASGHEAAVEASGDETVTLRSPDGTGCPLEIWTTEYESTRTIGRGCFGDWDGPAHAEDLVSSRVRFATGGRYSYSWGLGRLRRGAVRNQIVYPPYPRRASSPDRVDAG